MAVRFASRLLAPGRWRNGEGQEVRVSCLLARRIACPLVLFASGVCLCVQTPQTVKELEGRGSAMEKKGDAQGSLAVWQKAAKLEPKSAPIEDHIGFLLAVLNRRQEAIPHFRRALELNPRFAPAQYHLGVAYWLEKNVNDAVPQLLAAADSAPAN